MQMYLRPGNLFKEFIVKSKEADVSDIGLPVAKYKDTGILVNGVLLRRVLMIARRPNTCGSGSAFTHSHYCKLDRTGSKKRRCSFDGK